jgi:hypothetical protein
VSACHSSRAPNLDSMVHPAVFRLVCFGGRPTFLAITLPPSPPKAMGDREMGFRQRTLHRPPPSNLPLPNYVHGRGEGDGSGIWLGWHRPQRAATKRHACCGIVLRCEGADSSSAPPPPTGTMRQLAATHRATESFFSNTPLPHAHALKLCRRRQAPPSLPPLRALCFFFLYF